MKKSIAYLPKKKQEDLRSIVDLVLNELPDCEMIILYGSYARNDYVDYDQRTEYGVRTYFMSDYDILVVTGTRFRDYIIGNIFSRVKDRFYTNKNRLFYTSIQFINESIADLNQAIDKGFYFYTDIKKEGVMLYDSGRYKLARRRKPNFEEIEELARRYYNKNFNRGELFLKNAAFNASIGEDTMASFMLHQACENFYRSVILTYTLYTYKDHNLESLSGSAKTHSLEISKAFPRDTEEEERLFELLLKAYVQSRYNLTFTVTKEDIEALMPKVELLRDITRKCCEEQLKEYAERAKK